MQQCWAREAGPGDGGERTCNAFCLKRWLIVLMSSCDIVSCRMPIPAEAHVCAALSESRSRNGSRVSRGTLRKRVGAASPAVYVSIAVATACAWRRVGANTIAGFALAYCSTVLYVGLDIACRHACDVEYMVLSTRTRRIEGAVWLLRGLSNVRPVPLVVQTDGELGHESV